MEVKTRIKKTAMSYLDDIIVQIFKAIAHEASNLCEHSRSKVLGKKSLEAATKILLPGEMAQYAIEEAQTACQKFQQYEWIYWYFDFFKIIMIKTQNIWIIINIIAANEAIPTCNNFSSLSIILSHVIIWIESKMPYNSTTIY